MRRITLITSMVSTVLAALAVAGPASAANMKRHHSSGIRSASVHATKATQRVASLGNLDATMANYAAGYMTEGNNVPQGGNRYEPGFAGWASYARGYKASHPGDFSG
jgi:hypothetical protein